MEESKGRSGSIYRVKAQSERKGCEGRSDQNMVVSYLVLTVRLGSLESRIQVALL